MGKIYFETYIFIQQQGRKRERAKKTEEKKIESYDIIRRRERERERERRRKKEENRENTKYMLYGPICYIMWLEITWKNNMFGVSLFKADRQKSTRL